MVVVVASDVGDHQMRVKRLRENLKHCCNHNASNFLKVSIC